MTESKQTNRHIILIALANVLVLCLCALLWNCVFARNPVYEEQIVVTQTPFELSVDSVQRYSWTVSYVGGLPDMTLRIVDDTDAMVYETRIYAADVTEDGRFVSMVETEETMPLAVGTAYTARFYLDDGSEYTGQAYVALYGGQASLALWFGIVCVCALAICNLILALAWQAGRRADGAGRTSLILVVAIFVLLGLLMNVIYPPMDVPDEENHLRTTYYWSGRILPDDGGDVQGEAADYVIFNVPTGVRQSMGNLPVTQQIYSYWYDQEYGNDISTQALWSYNGAGNYVGYGYTPAILGLTAARALHASYQTILLVGRICNYLVFLLLVVLTCKVAPDLRMATLAIAGLPSTIWLAASYSYDGWNLGFSMLFVAYLWRLTTHKEQIGLRQIIMMVLLLLAFAPIKYIYVILALLVFAIPARQWKNRKVLIGAILIGGVGAVIALRSRIAEAIDYLTTSKTDTRGLEQNLSGEPYNVSYVLHHPLETALTFVQTFYTDLEKMVNRMLVGEFHSDYVPGYLAMALGILFVLLLLVATRESLQGRERISKGTKTIWIYRIVLALGICAVYGSFLFLYSYYRNGEIGVISGVQGRYFLPLILLLAPAGSARLATSTGKWMDRHRIQPMQLWAAALYVGLLVLLCRMPGFVL